MKQLCEQGGAKFVLVYIPTKERVYLPLLRGRFTAKDIGWETWMKEVSGSPTSGVK